MTKTYADCLKILAKELKEGRYMKEKGHGTPGQPVTNPLSGIGSHRKVKN